MTRSMPGVNRAILLIALTLCTTAEGDDDAARLMLSSDPPGATVLIGNYAIGTTPLKSHAIKAQGQTLTISLNGFVPRTILLPYQQQGDIKLGTLPLAKRGTTITVWLVGSRGDDRRVALPERLAKTIRELGFEVQVEGCSSATFPERFRKASSAEEGAHLPDVVIARSDSDYLSFAEVERDEKLAALLKRTKGYWNLAGLDTFLIAGSKAETAAQCVAMVNEGVSHSIALDETKLKDLPGQLNPEFGRTLLQRQNQAVAMAYLTNRMESVEPLFHEHMLPLVGAHRDRPAGGIVAAVRPFYVLGNNRLAFVLSSATYLREEGAGCQNLLTVWSRPKEDWKLLSVTNDPHSIREAEKQIPDLAQKLKVGMRELVEPAEIKSPPDGEFPRAPVGERFGNFVWRPSTSKQVVAELIEFNYENATRFIFSSKGVVSSGMLWTTGGPWKWRVWSISKQGVIAFSEDRDFRH